MRTFPDVRRGSGSATRREGGWMSKINKYDNLGDSAE